MQSIIESLLSALSKYSEDMASEPKLQGLPDFPCTESFTEMGEEAAYQRLSRYQTLAEKLHTLLSRDPLVDTATLNQDLLQHLKDDHVHSTSVRSSLPASNNTFNEIKLWVETVRCWVKQVEKLKRA